MADSLPPTSVPKRLFLSKTSGTSPIAQPLVAVLCGACPSYNAVRRHGGDAGQDNEQKPLIPSRGVRILDRLVKEHYEG